MSLRRKRPLRKLRYLSVEMCFSTAKFYIQCIRDRPGLKGEGFVLAYGLKGYSLSGLGRELPWQEWEAAGYTVS